MESLKYYLVGWHYRQENHCLARRNVTLDSSDWSWLFGELGEVWQLHYCYYPRIPGHILQCLQLMTLLKHGTTLLFTWISLLIVSSSSSVVVRGTSVVVVIVLVSLAKDGSSTVMLLMTLFTTESNKKLCPKRRRWLLEMPEWSASLSWPARGENRAPGWGNTRTGLDKNILSRLVRVQTSCGMSQTLLGR